MSRVHIGWRVLVVFMFMLTALVVVGCNGSPTDTAAGPEARADSLLDRVQREKVLRVGYSGYPPFLSIDVDTKVPSGGFSVDLIERLVEEWDPTISIAWVPTNWTNVRTDLVAGKFDLVVEPVFRTIPRAAVVDFSRPFASFGYAIGVVQADDERFREITDINGPEVLISVGQGLSSHEYLREHLPGATNLRVIPGGQAHAALDEVLLGRVDIALSDSTTIDAYLEAHPGQLRVVFDNPPPGRVYAGFMFRQGDYKLASFLNIALDYLDTSGQLERLRQQHGVR